MIVSNRPVLAGERCRLSFVDLDYTVQGQLTMTNPPLAKDFYLKELSNYITILDAVSMLGTNRVVVLRLTGNGEYKLCTFVLGLFLEPQGVCSITTLFNLVKTTLEINSAGIAQLFDSANKKLIFYDSNTPNLACEIKNIAPTLFSDEPNQNLISSISSNFNLVEGTTDLGIYGVNNYVLFFKPSDTNLTNWAQFNLATAESATGEANTVCSTPMGDFVASTLKNTTTSNSFYFTLFTINNLDNTISNCKIPSKSGSPLAKYCMKCNTGFRIEVARQQCTSSCVNGNEDDDLCKIDNCPKYCVGCTSGICTECEPAFYINVTENKCAVACPITGYLTIELPKKRCELCDSSCKQCSQAAKTNSCTECYSPENPQRYLTLSSSCETQCINSYISSVSPPTCGACHADCLTCSGPNTTDCLTCRPSPASLKFFFENTCSASCPTNTFNNGADICLKCHDSCSTCSNSSQNDCMSCSSTQQITKYFQNNQCFVNNCPPGFYNIPPVNGDRQGLCGPCIVGCSTCTQNTGCSACRATYYLHLNTCVQACPNGFLKIENPATCESCVANCRICSNTISCDICDSGFMSNPNNTCSPTTCLSTEYYNSNLSSCVVCGHCGDAMLSTTFSCSNGASCQTCGKFYVNSIQTKLYLNTSLQCVISCGTGFFKNETSQVCTQCHALCQDCLSPGAQNCSSCLNSQGNTTNNCCPTGSYLANQYDIVCTNCHNSCSKCTGLNSCTECAQGFLLKGTLCVLSCGDGFYNLNGICQNCSIPCSNCVSLSSCLTCDQNQPLKLLQGSSCVSQCPPRHYQDNQACIPCPIGCDSCSNGSSCDSCSSNYSNPNTIFPNMCYPNCMADKFMTLTGTCFSCSNQCLSCSILANRCQECKIGFFEESPFYCTETCPGNTYPNSLNKKCEPCHAECGSCSGSRRDQCQSCSSTRTQNAVLLNTECIATCPAPLINIQQTCTTCPNSQPYYYQSSCVGVCGIGTYLDAIGKTCFDCSPNCVQCQGSPEICTSCPSNKFVNPNTKTCEIIPNSCPQGQLLVNNICVQMPCDSRCSSCSSVGDCIIRLTPQITEKNTDAQSNLTLKLNLKLYLVQEPIDDNKFQAVGYTLKLQPLKINLENKVLEYKLAYDTENKLELEIKLPEQLLEGSSYTLKFTSIEQIAEKIENSNFKTIYWMDDKIEDFQFLKGLKIPQSDIDFAEVISKNMGSSTKVTAHVTDALSILSMFLSADQSGATLKFSQISKLLSRLRMLDVNFGEVFGTFLDSMGEAFDGEDTSHSLEEKIKTYKTKQKLLYLYQKNFEAKFNKYAVKPFLFGTARKNWDKRLILNKMKSLLVEYKNEDGREQAKKRLLQLDEKFDEAYTFSGVTGEIKYWFYFVSWIWKFVSMLMIMYIRHTKRISVNAIKVIRMQRKIHFLVFNLIIVDIAFFGTRTLTQMTVTKEIAFQLVTTFLSFILILLDILEIVSVSIKIIFKAEAKEDSFQIDKETPEQRQKRLKKATQKAVYGKYDKKDKNKARNKNQVHPEEKVTENEKNDDSVMHHVYLKDYECNPEGFIERKKGFGFREYFQEDKMIKYVMSKEEATQSGYFREVDYERTERNIESNEPIENHATSELKKDDPSIYSKKSILLANFGFLIRIVGYHVILVSFSKNSLCGSLSLMGIELGYLGLIIRNFLKLRYLVSLHMFISKVTQSLFLILFHIVTLIIITKYGIKDQPSLSIQKVGMWSIIIAIICEYFFLIVNLIYIIKTFVKQCKHKKINKPVQQDDLIHYKWVRGFGWEDDSKNILFQNGSIYRSANRQKRNQVQSGLKAKQKSEKLDKNQESRLEK